MAQYARPDADDTDGNWTDKSGGSTLYTSIDETSADDSTTYIKVTDNGSNEICIVRLSDVDTPDAGNAYIRVKAKTSDNAWTGNPPDLKVELLEGSTSRVSNTFTSVSTSGWGDLSYTFNGLGVSISDWSNLKLRLTMMAGDGGGMMAGDEMHVTIAYLETQDAASASVPISAIVHNTYQQLRTP
tara:strand:+ start:12473 stop:13027 length:555 start_codon:yes stop_codon:yes gene_type:complete